MEGERGEKEKGSAISTPPSRAPFPFTFRGRGAVTAIAAAGDVVVLTTARGYLLRYDLASGGPPTEVELSRAPGAAAAGLWLDSSGTHAVVSLATGGASGPAEAETLYLHASWKKARPVAGLVGVATTAAAFDDGPAGGGATTPASTGEILIGTASGGLRSFTWGERDRAEGGVSDTRAMPGPRTARAVRPAARPAEWRRFLQWL